MCRGAYAFRRPRVSLTPTPNDHSKTFPTLALPVRPTPVTMRSVLGPTTVFVSENMRVSRLLGFRWAVLRVSALRSSGCELYPGLSPAFVPVAERAQASLLVAFVKVRANASVDALRSEASIRCTCLFRTMGCGPITGFDCATSAGAQSKGRRKACIRERIYV